jgi:hypothetical protein
LDLQDNPDPLDSLVHPAHAARMATEDQWARLDHRVAVASLAFQDRKDLLDLLVQ